MASSANVIKTLTIRNRVEGAQDVRSLSAAYADVAASSEKLARAALTLADSQLRQQRAFDQAIQQQKALSAANDNLARSYAAANDNNQSFIKGMADRASSAVELAGHLKLLALAAYALFPALRALVNPVIGAGLAATGSAIAAISPAAATVAGTIVSKLMPALAFLSRIAFPILLIVEAWKALNYVIQLGSGLLEKYGNEQRNLVAGVDDNLKKLTRFQDEGLSAQQVQLATELGGRLLAAKKTISDFFEVQFNLTEPALKLQAAWVKIVETIASGFDLLNRFINLLGSIPVTKLPGVGPFVSAVGGLTGAGSGPEPSREELLAAARQRLAAGMGSNRNFSVRFGQAINDLANPPKVEKPEEIKATGDAWTRYADQVAKANATIEANTRTMGLGAQAHEQLKIQLQGEQILQREGVKDTEERRKKLAELAEAAGLAALALEKAKVANQIEFDRKTAFLSPEDVQIAQQLKGIYGNDIPAALASSEAAAIRLNNQLKSVNTIIRDAVENLAKGFVSNLMQGKSAMDSMVLSARNLSQALASQAITEAFKGNIFGAVASGIGALVSGLFGSKKTSEEKLAEIKVAQEAAAERLRIETEANDKLIAEAKAAADEQLRIARDLHDRQLSFQDRVFQAANDNNTLAGQLAAFDRQANRERLVEQEAGNGAVIDLEAALAAERFNIQRDFNTKAIEDEQRAAKERRDAINSAAKNILDYVQGLLAGPGSTLSPQARLTNAQSTYNTKLTAALGGDVNAQSSITQDADNLLKAARDVFASSSAFQDLQTQVISQLLSLPAVTSTTDPLLQATRDVLGAINAGNATQALDATLNNVIKTAIDAGNAAAIAALLVPKFDTLNTTSGLGLTYANFLTGLGPTGAALAKDATAGSLLTQQQLAGSGLASETTLNSKLASIFTELDVNGDGLLQKSELIRANTFPIGAVAANSNALPNMPNQIAVGLAGSGNDGGLINLRNLQADTVALLASINAVQTQIHGDDLTIVNRLDELSRGGLTAANLSRTTENTFHISGANLHGLAGGGIIPPFGTALVSEHLNPTFLRAGPEPIHVFPGSPSNDNSATIGELRALRQEVARLSAIVAGSNARVAQAVVEAGEGVEDAVADGMGKVAFETRQAARKNAA